MREKTFEKEKSFLSRYAMRSCDSAGRDIYEEPCPMRTDFQRDRDRIIYSKAFRRLKNKTQVFFSPQGDHFITRLTHTLDVSQVARSIARTLALNEDLTEAAALGHDLGHTPFGHSGERILNDISPSGFEHNVQSRRVVEYLSNDGKGLNLTKEVRDGIENHKMSLDSMTLEGRCVAFADWIAYINHDIEDAVSAGVITKEDLPRECVEILGDSTSKRINTMIFSIYRESYGLNKVQMENTVFEATRVLRDFMFERVYASDSARGEEKKAERMLECLYGYFKKRPEKLPEFYRKDADEFGVDAALCDYISSMTDRYAVYTFENIFVPKSWQL